MGGPEPAPSPDPSRFSRRLFVIRDPLLGDIRLTPSEKDVLDSDIFQRQRGVKQLGTSLLLYPSAVQTRFVHALGNLQLAGRMVRRAFENDPAETKRFAGETIAWLRDLAANTADVDLLAQMSQDDIREFTEQIVRLAGMCHDLGHFPMGHVLEYALENEHVVRRLLQPVLDDYALWHERGAAIHEFASLKLLESNGGNPAGATPVRPFGPDNDLLRRAVLEVLRATHHKNGEWAHKIPRALGELISSEIDSDRAEYLRRDSAVSGSGYGQYDIDRLLGSYALAYDDGAWLFRTTSRALAAIETFLLERVKAYGHLYYHTLGVLMDALLVDVLLALYRDTDKRNLAGEMASAGLKPDGIEALFSQLPLQQLSYEQFGGTRGYVDDATLWMFLRAVLTRLETTSIGTEHVRLQRLRTFLRVVLRRRPHWVALWKRPEEFKDASELALRGFREGVQEQHGSSSQEINDALAKVLSELTESEYRDGASVLNFIAHSFYKSDRLARLAELLESDLGIDPEVGRLFVVIGQRASFRPLKDANYKIIDGEGNPRRLSALTPAAIRAIRAWWFDGYPQLRMYVLAERELNAQRRTRIRSTALAHLPDAVRTWHSEVYGEGVTFNPEEILHAKTPKKSAS